MSFMQPEIYEASYWEVDGNCGVDIIPEFVHPTLPVDASDKEVKAQIPQLMEFTESTEIYGAEIHTGFIGRYSAPGYMDCTPWVSGSTEREVAEYLEEFYGEDEEE